MEILSLNVNGEKFNRVNSINELMNACNADLYCFQEYKFGLHKKGRINTVNYYNSDYQKNSKIYKSIWNHSFFWLEYPENYIAENEISLNFSAFILINVHLAGFILARDIR